MAEFSFTPPKKIGVFAPSSYVEEADIRAAEAIMRERGHDVFIHPQTLARAPTPEGQSAGSHSQKTEALHELYLDTSIDAIWAAGGGNRSLHILDHLDFDLIRSNPKPMIGFSDVTALLNGITLETGIANIHAPVFKQLSQCAVLDTLLGWDFEIPLDGAASLQNGIAHGRLFGGNLSLFQYLTPHQSFDGAILFLEDCNEEISRIDRMLAHLRRNGVLARAEGIVFGQFTDLQDSSRPFGYTLDDIVREHTSELDIPIIMNAPIGHGKENYPVVIGAKYMLDITTERISLTLQNV